MANPISIPQDFSTTLNVGGGIDNAQTSGIVLTSVSGLPTDGGILCFDWANPLDTTKAEYIEYTGISGNTLTGVIRGQEGFSAKSHTNGCTVAGVFSQAHIKRLRDKLTGNDATAIQDPNGNAILKTAYNASAVNQVTVSNQATGSAPTITATGGDTNIDLAIQAKGTGNVKLGNAGLKFPNSDGSNTQVLQTNGSGILSFATITNPTDGWTSDSNTWVYVSASSFKITGSNVTTQFPKGTRVKCTNNSTTFYGVVASSSFSTDTTVTLVANTDYSLANSAITNPFYSYQVSPQGYPGWFNYTPTWGGFSANPTVTYCRFAVFGNTCYIEEKASANGTSNAGTFTFTAPVAPAQSILHTINGYVVDSGSIQTTIAIVGVSSGSTLQLAKDTSQNFSGWTSSGGKSANWSFFFEF